jgi:hypothetical protein
MPVPEGIISTSTGPAESINPVEVELPVEETEDEDDSTSAVEE